MKFTRRLRRLEQAVGIVGGQLPCAVCVGRAFTLFVTRFMGTSASGTITNVHGQTVDGPADCCSGCGCRFAETVMVKGIDPRLL